MAEVKSLDKSATLIKDIIEALNNLKGWGSVEIFVQNGRVTQITERAIKKTNHDLKSHLDKH